VVPTRPGGDRIAQQPHHGALFSLVKRYSFRQGLSFLRNRRNVIATTRVG
jgi:hypothetical protein